MWAETKGILTNVTDYTLHTIYLHFLWLLGTVAGIGVAGWMPATLAMFSVWRQILKEPDKKIKIAPAFWKEYKTHFWKKNLIGFIIIGLIAFLYVDLQFFLYLQGPVAFLFSIGLFFLLLFILAQLLFFPSIYAHFDLTMLQYFKKSFVFACLSPVVLICGISTAVLLGIIYYNMPGLMVLLGYAPLAAVIMKIVLMRLEQMEKKHDPSSSIQS